MNPETWAGLTMATVLWAIVAAAVLGAPAAPPKELWVSTSSDRVRSHPTLVRAANPVMTRSILARGKTDQGSSLSF